MCQNVWLSTNRSAVDALCLTHATVIASVKHWAEALHGERKRLRKSRSGHWRCWREGIA